MESRREERRGKHRGGEKGGEERRGAVRRVERGEKVSCGRGEERKGA